MHHSTRPMEPSDLSGVVALSRRIYGAQHGAAAEWRHASHPTEVPRFVVLSEGQLVGYASLWTEAWFEHHRRRRAELLVHPDHRCRGLGTALLHQLVAEFRTTEARTLEARVSETQRQGLAFTQARGFAAVASEWDLHLRPASADLSELLTAEAAVSRQGITVTTLAAERDATPDYLQRFHALWAAVEADQPPAGDGETGEPPPFEPFIGWLRRQEAIWDGIFLAVDGDRWVGLSVLTLRKAAPGWVFQNLTGTLREYRRRGIARLLKLRAVEYAQERGYGVIVATNSSRNAPMLALNEKLGFVRQPGWVTLERTP